MRRPRSLHPSIPPRHSRALQKVAAILGLIWIVALALADPPVAGALNLLVAPRGEAGLDRQPGLN